METSVNQEDKEESAPNRPGLLDQVRTEQERMMESSGRGERAALWVEKRGDRDGGQLT